MYSSLSRLSSSLIHRLARCQGELIASRSFSVSRMPPGPLENFQQGLNSSETVATDSRQGFTGPAENFQQGFISSETVTRNSRQGFTGPLENFQHGFNSSETVATNSRQGFTGPLENIQQGFNSSDNVTRNSRQGFNSSDNVARNSRQGFPIENFQQGLNSSDNVARNSRPGFYYSENVGRNSRSMNFVRGIIEEDGNNNFGGSQYPRYSLEQNADVVHIKLMKNNTFVTVTDSKGNKKLGASAGSLPEMKGGPKLSKYAAEATAEHVGRMARNFGLKSVVMKVRGFTYFKKKRQAIMSWKDGFTNSKVGMSPVVYIEDTTRKPHNGCRLPKQRRV